MIVADIIYVLIIVYAFCFIYQNIKYKLFDLTSWIFKTSR